MSGLLPVFGPVAEPVRNVTAPGPYRCGCRPDLGASCTRCDGTSQDGWAVERESRDQQAWRERQMRTNPDYRAAWLAGFDRSLRESMAAMADHHYGPIEQLRRTA